MLPRLELSSGVPEDQLSLALIYSKPPSNKNQEQT